MANLGIIDADPSEPPCTEEVIKLANRLLDEFNIPTTIEDIGDICAALFVLLYENLFSDRLSDIIRHPVSKEDEIHNCQMVIDVLSTDIVHDSLSHIRGVDIIEGDITAISNLLDIFSYLLEYVANKIDSDIATDNDDNNNAVIRHEKYCDMTRPRVMSPSYVRGDKLDSLVIPPSPIRPDQSQSLLGQKTVDSTELELQIGKIIKGSMKGSPIPKVAWDERSDLNEKFDASSGVDDGVDASISANVAAPSKTATATTNDVEPDTLGLRSGNVPYLSASMPPPKQACDEGKDVPFHLTIGPIDTSHTPNRNVPERKDDPTLVKGLSSSYNDLRHLVERTAAMTRVALQTSPIIGRGERILNLTDITDGPRPSIPSDGVRLVKELNAQGMRRGEPHNSPSKHTKKVAFSSYTDELSDRPCRHGYPLEELSDNDYTKDLNMYSKRKEKRGHLGHGYDSLLEDYKSRSKATLPEQRKQTKKVQSKKSSFANHLARSRQPELGAAHLKLKTEDRAIKKKQDFLQRLYQEDFEEFSEDIRALLDKDNKTCHEKEREMLKSYQASKPLVKGTKKNKSNSNTVSLKKQKLGYRIISSKARGCTSSPPLKLESEEDLLPFLLEEFPHLHLSDHTWHELCRKGLHQIEAITKVYQENKCKKSHAQIQLEEAAQRQEILSDIMRKELDQTKRLREIKEQKTKQIQMQNKSHEKRVQSARARRYYNEYQVRARSKQLKRRTKEEMVFRDLFKDAMKIQKERIKDIRQYASDQRKSQESRRQNEMESLENFYQDQFKMLAEKLAQERRDSRLRDKAQQQMMKRTKQELRKKIESEICLYQEQLFRDDDDSHFRQMDADRVKRQLHMARYAAQI